MSKNKQPKWARNLARDGWLPCIGGYRHIKSDMKVLRTVDLNDPDDNPAWRVLDHKGRLVQAYPNLTEAMLFADATVTLMEDS